MTTDPIPVERIQTGVRMEKRIVKVLKALAEYHDMTLGDLLEGIVLHAFEGKAPFGRESLQKIIDLKKVYELDLDATASHRLMERRLPAGRVGGGPPAGNRRRSS
jgi:hypothetical protein